MSLSQTEAAPRSHKPDAAAYWQALRAFSFPASIVSVLLGTALAGRGLAATGSVFHPVIFLLTLLGALLAHAGGNVFNDYFDFVRGVDTRPEHGSGVIVRGLLTAGQMRNFGIALLGGAAVCGIAIMLLSPATALPVLLLALVGAACAVLYTSVLKRFALGDLVIITSFGIGLTTGAYAVQIPVHSLAQFGWIALAALPVALLVDAILHANNMRDAADDADCGVRTVAVLLGAGGSRAFQAVLLFAPVALVEIGSLTHLLPTASFIVLLSLPLLVKAFQSGDVPSVAQSHLIFGVLYAGTIAFFAR